ncbi:MAG: ATP-grasp domain-containing protein [bacterium]
MSIGILYESVEWSNQHLCDLINGSDIKTELINLETGSVSFQRILQHRLIVNRLFPSAPLRGFKNSFSIARNVLKVIDDQQIPMINPFAAYAYDCSKICSMQALSKKTIPVPKSLAYFSSTDQLHLKDLPYPNVLKPDCCGRCYNTYILNNQQDLKETLQNIPEQPYIIQEYIKPVKNFTTRIEIVGKDIMTINKRYLGSNGLSGYHAGSVFKDYPDCPDKIIKSSFKALATLHIDMGSLDIIETDNDQFHIIDVNATSNFSEDNVEMLGFDPIKVMAEYIINQYASIDKSK